MSEIQVSRKEGRGVIQLVSNTKLGSQRAIDECTKMTASVKYVRVCFDRLVLIRQGLRPQLKLDSLRAHLAGWFSTPTAAALSCLGCERLRGKSSP